MSKQIGLHGIQAIIGMSITSMRHRARGESNLAVLELGNESDDVVHHSNAKIADMSSGVAIHITKYRELCDCSS